MIANLLCSHKTPILHLSNHPFNYENQCGHVTTYGDHALSFTAEYAEIDTSILEVYYHMFLEYKQVCSLDLSFLPAIYWQRPLFSAKWVKECFTASAIGILVHVRCEVFWSRQHSKYHIAQKFGRPIKVWNVWCCDFWLNSNQDNRRLCYLSFETHLQTAAINGTLDWESSQHQV